jgi:fructuronate reductase
MVGCSLTDRVVRSLDVHTASSCGPELIYRPRAEKAAPGVVHLGLGGFHRAHQAMVFDEILASGDNRWGICGVGIRNPSLVQQLQAQDGLYLVRLSDAQGERWHAPSSLMKTCVAAHDQEAVVQQIASPQTRWVTLTVTEKAYTPVLARLLVDGLSRRQAHNLPGLTLASCDNLPNNGRVLQLLCEDLARTQNGSLADWIVTQCRFPSSMVDRIVPAPSVQVREAAHEVLGLDDPTALGVEAFWEWVIEDAFVDPFDAQVLRAFGVVVTDDVVGYEQAKLWMLNGSHTALASLGAVLGDRFIREVIARPAARAFIDGLMSTASGPLVLRPNWQTYRDALLVRFSSPALDHSVLQVLADSSAKIPLRWKPVIERLMQAPASHRQAGLEYMAVALAVFIRSLTPVTEANQPFSFQDPLASVLQAAAVQQRSDPAQAVAKVLSHSGVFGKSVANNQGLQHSVTHWLTQIHAHGVVETLRACVHDNA